jgi:asparagine synthase (glutamine-hydrolysing)
MVADVPVGAFLSGGLDSSSIVALMSPVASGRLRTFSISFDEPQYNETSFAKLVVQRFNTDHHACRVKDQDVHRDLDHFIASLDQPSVDGLNTYYVSKFTHVSGIKVAMSGLGGDELFGGYPSFRQLPRLSGLMRFGKRFPGALSLARMVTHNNRFVYKYRKLNRMLGTDGSIPELYAIGRSLFFSDTIAHLLAPGSVEDTVIAETLSEAQVGPPAPDVIDSPWTLTSWLEMERYMRNQLLRDTDCLSMSNSLEVRVPLLDYRLVEFVMGLPEKIKRSGRCPKPLLARAMSPLLPREIMRRRKMTFTLPLKEWMRGSLRKEIGDVLCAPPVKLRAIIDPAATGLVWKDFLNGRMDWTRPWGLVVLIKWLTQHGLD